VSNRELNAEKFFAVGLLSDTEPRTGLASTRSQL